MSDDLVRILGEECPVCGDTYHDLPRHLALNYKGCADPAVYAVSWGDAGSLTGR